MKADTLLTHGRFTTLDDVKPQVDSIAILDGKIVWMGSNDEANKMDAAEVIDPFPADQRAARIDNLPHAGTGDNFKGTVLTDGVVEDKEYIAEEDVVAQPVGGQPVEGHSRIAEQIIVNRAVLDNLIVEGA